MLPDPVNAKTGKAKRAREIVKLLAEREHYDVLVFQEAFEERVRRIIKKGLKSTFPYRLGPGNFRPLLIKTNSGVWVLSRTPMKKLAEVQFKDCEGFADCMARKGVLAIETEWKGRTLQIIGTHIQASDHKGLPVKESQYTQLGRVVNDLARPGVPQVVCGDFNMRRSNEARYHAMLNALCVEDYCLNTMEFTVHGQNAFRNRPGYEAEIDFIFYRHNGLPPANVIRSTRIFQGPWSANNHDLSDHYAVEALVVY